MAGVRLGRPDLGVVVGELHPDAGRGERLRHADRDHQRIGPVLAIGRLEDEAAAVRLVDAARARPSTVVAHIDPGPLREQGEVLLHLRA